MDLISLEVIRQTENERKTIPSCKHGPGLLFQRGNQRFYACSANRDHKICKLLVQYQDWKPNINVDQQNKSSSPFARTYPYLDIDEFKNIPEEDRCYCHKCGLLYQQSTEGRKHSSHKIQTNITHRQLCYPSTILRPLELNKSEAQYFFNSNTIETVCNILESNEFSNVVCIGTPKIHEHLRNSINVSSSLLDLDKRHYSFYKPTEFHCFNMFNNYFFNEDEFLHFKTNLRKGKLCLVIDPPFGGRIEPLAQTISEISALYKSLENGNCEDMLPCILILPYFMEPQIHNFIPELQMSDYQVQYENHHSFKQKGKKGSPIRLFTNIPLNKISLAHDDQYKYCNVCNKWVGKWNNHCVSCNGCVSKNGTTYKHCKICNRCVKSSWNHCESCNRCSLKNHSCSTPLPIQKCFMCKCAGHKKDDCPLDIKNIKQSSPTPTSRRIVNKKKINKKKERRRRIRANLQKYKKVITVQ